MKTDILCKSQVFVMHKKNVITIATIHGSNRISQHMIQKKKQEEAHIQISYVQTNNLIAKQQI